MPGDFVENDIDSMMNTAELATAGVWTDQATPTPVATAIVGMYDAGFIEIDPITGETVNVDPSFIVKTLDVPGIKQGDNITIDSKSFNVLKPVPSYSDNIMTIIMNEVVT